MQKVLHVGCGRKTIQHIPAFFQDGRWTEVRLDIDPSVQPDVIGTITNMERVPSGSVQAVFSSHNIEHVFPHEVPQVFSEFRRVLSSEGFALMTCPDLQSVASVVASDKLMEPLYQSGMGPISAIDIMYGHRASVAAGNTYMAHRGGFTLSSLRKALRDVGFHVAIMRRPANFDLWAIGAVSNLGEGVLKEMASKLFPR